MEEGLAGPNGNIFAMVMWDPDGPGPLPPRLVVGGDFQEVNGQNSAWHAAAWNPTTGQWTGTAGGDGPSEDVYSLCTRSNGDLIAGGTGIWRFDGTTWSTLAWPNDYVHALAVGHDGSLFAGGQFQSVGGVNTGYGIARWDGSAWSSLAGGVTGPWPGSVQYVSAIAVLPNGNLVAGGRFAYAGGVSANNIAQWDGSSWSPLGTGVGGNVYALAVLHNGDIIAAGSFLQAGGAPARLLARWDGSAWSPFGDPNTYVFALTVLANGDLLAGGSFTTIGGIAATALARWDGATWSPVAGAGSVGVSSIAVLPSGDLALGGGFGNVGGIWRRFARVIEPSPDFNHDGDPGTDADIEAFFACLSGSCCPTCGSVDFNGDGDIGTDADIDAFFRVLAGGSC